MSKVIENKISTLIEPLIIELGFELVGVEYLSLGKNNILRIYIDNEYGINIDDCVEVTRQVSPLLDVEDLIKNEYNLEVSSPGLERPLFKIQDYQRFIGEDISLQLNMPVENQRKWSGKLINVDGELVIIQTKEEKEQSFMFGNIKKANLVAKF